MCNWGALLQLCGHEYSEDPLTSRRPRLISLHGLSIRSPDLSALAATGRTRSEQSVFIASRPMPFITQYQAANTLGIHSGANQMYQ